MRRRRRSYLPPGCTVQSGPGGDWAAHYNRGRGDDDAPGYTPVNRQVAVTQGDCMWEAVKVFGNKVRSVRGLQVGRCVGRVPVSVARARARRTADAARPSPRSWGHLPYGCSVQSGPGGDWAAHWNNRAGRNDGTYTPVKPSDASYGPPYHEAFWERCVPLVVRGGRNRRARDRTTRAPATAPD